MAIIRIEGGQDQVYNGAGIQLVGSHAPDQEGLSPKELLESALALCISITLQKLLERDGVSYEKDEIIVEVKARKEEGVTNRFTHFHTTLTFPSVLDPAYRAKLLTIVERSCTISNTLRGDVVIETIEK
ncbi:OsmC family protein [Bacillus horti]|uniref:OsmC-like protein n=1 Tax=Caldalkalibacillus horti TaxID=77523 RepID=A0ABT9W0Q9_9BACI|nr:OsmC family protein [Bacillus horti]MDQ0166812.1 putative OsmC-like protein [Bacillus horti]